MDMTGSYLLIIGHFYNLHHFLSTPNSTHNLTSLVRTVILCPHGECSPTLSRMALAGTSTVVTMIPENKREKKKNTRT